MSVEDFNQAGSEDVNLTDGTSLAKERKAIQDSNDLEALRELRHAPWFKTYYERRLMEEREAHVKNALSDVPFERVLESRAVIRFIDKLLKMPESDRLIKFGNLHPGLKPQPED